jgi:hypothetical protein
MQKIYKGKGVTPTYLANQFKKAEKKGIHAVNQAFRNAENSVKTKVRRPA